MYVPILDRDLVIILALLTAQTRGKPREEMDRAQVLVIDLSPRTNDIINLTH